MILRIAQGQGQITTADKIPKVIESFFYFDHFEKFHHDALNSKGSRGKLENCVCKTQVMPPCPKPVLTPCSILTHDPQHIQSIQETNV